jgi:hypothetical protein
MAQSVELRIAAGREQVREPPQISLAVQKGVHFRRSSPCRGVGDLAKTMNWGVHFRSSPLCCGVGTLAKNDRKEHPGAVERRVGRAVEPAVARAVALTFAVAGSSPHDSADRGHGDVLTYLRHPEVSA